MQQRIRTALTWCALVIVVIAEPITHLFGLPHPEGLTQIILNHLATTGGHK